MIKKEVIAAFEILKEEVEKVFKKMTLQKTHGKSQKKELNICNKEVLYRN